MAIQNACGGTGQPPVRTYRTPMSMGARFGGKLRGMCPEEGCEAKVNPNGRLAKHEVNAGEFMRRQRMRDAEPHDPNANSPHHWS
jgi:hypothetical protein